MRMGDTPQNCTQERIPDYATSAKTRQLSYYKQHAMGQSSRNMPHTAHHGGEIVQRYMLMMIAARVKGKAESMYHAQIRKADRTIAIVQTVLSGIGTIQPALF